MSTQENISNTQESPVNTQESSSVTQESSRSKVISILTEHPTYTLIDVASQIGLTRDGVKKIVDKLRAEGILSREGSTKGGKWIVNSGPI